MGKYDPLATYLRRQKDRTIEMSFREIENRIGALLPKAAAHPKWWRAETNETPALQHKAWASSGHQAELLPCRERVRFKPVATD